MITTEKECFPSTELTNPDDERIILELVGFLKKRIQTRHLLQKDLRKRQADFRSILIDLKCENTSLKAENSSLRTCVDQQKKTISSLEGRICKLDGQIDSLLYKLNSANDALRTMQQELRDKDKQLRQYTIDKQKIIQKCNDKIQVEMDRMTKESETKLLEQRKQLESYIKKKDDKLKLVKQILISSRGNMSDNVASLMDSCLKTKTTEKLIPMFEKKPAVITSINFQNPSSSKIISDNTAAKIKSDTEISKNVMTPIDIQGPSVSKVISNNTAAITRTKSDTKVSKSVMTSIDPQDPSTSKTISNNTVAISKTKSDTEISRNVDDPSETELSRPSRRDKIPVVNLRYRPSQNAERWIDHRPAGMVPVGTILQPQTPRKRNVTKLINPKTFTVKFARYCLFAQEQDTDGELETKLYKADVLPTSGGGAQVVFNDVEYLKQISPTGARLHNEQIKTEN